MAQPAPLKQPSSPSITVGSLTNADPNFIPRKEFIKDHRVQSAFSLLTLSGSSLVRLFSFPPPVFSALHRLFDQHSLIAGIREHAPKHFYEFELFGKPWVNPKSIKTEKLIVDILTVILHHGYTFLATIDYGREPEDRIAMTFSKPTTIQPPTASTAALPNASAVSLNTPPRTPFAVSFATPTALRVVGPPLQLTPAVLQAVRGTWPRGVESENKVGDATYEFKLKGYKWYQEDRFPADSLKLILDLLTALDHYGFTLVTSLSLTKRVRGRDLWIFTGLQVPDSLHPDYPLTNPYGSNVELKREISPQTGLVSTLPAGAWVAPTGRSPPIPPGPSPLIGNGVTYHTRSVSDTTPMLSSPLKHSAFSFGKATGLLRRTTGKNTIPAAPVPEYPNSISSPEQSPRVAPSSVGSCDMTGVGTGIRQSMMDFQRTPDVFYTADGRQNGTLPQQEHNPFSMAFDSPYPVFPRRTSNESKHHSSSGPLDASRPRGLSESKSSPSPPADVSSRNTPTPQTPSPGRANGEPQQHVHVNEALKSPPTDAPRIPTPPLLASGVFRDSAFTSFTQRQSHEIPIAWTGRDPERTDKMMPQMEHERSTSGARNLSQRESDRDDVAHTMFPPTIREQPSQELDELTGAFAMSLNGEPSPDKQKGYVPSMSPKPVHPSGEALRKSEVAALGTLPQHDPKSRPSPPRDRKEKKPARERLDSGWVMVNVEGSEKSKGKGKQSSADRGRSKSPTSNGRPTPHTRSSSDSKVPSSRSRTPKSTGGNAPATMSAAAKAIVMIDAMDAKQEKAKTRSGFGRLLGRTKGSKDEGGTPSPPRSGTPGKRTPDATLSKLKSLEVEEVKWKKKDVPTTRSRDKRVSID